jgi:hypothetical protein
MSVELAMVMATVRLEESADCAVIDVVTPVGTTTVQGAATLVRGTVAFCTKKVAVAAVVPEPVKVPLNVASPQPVLVVVRKVGP